MKILLKQGASRLADIGQAVATTGRVGWKYVLNWLVWADQGINTALLGDPDETLSSRIGRNYHGSWAYKFVNCLFFWQKGKHCDEAIEHDEDEKDAIIK